MVFSPDRTMMASTHGDHNIYVTETKTGRCLQTLKAEDVFRILCRFYF